MPPGPLRQLKACSASPRRTLSSGSGQKDCNSLNSTEASTMPQDPACSGQALTRLADADESEELLRRLIADLPGMIWVSGGDGVHFVSPQWLSYTGLSLEATLGDNWLDAIHPDDLPEVRSIWKQAFHARRESIMEYRLRRHDGVYRWFASRGAPRTFGNGPPCWFGVCTDIDELKREEAELRESKEALRTTFEQAGIGIAHIGPDGSFLRTNGKFQEMTGYSEEELRHMRFPELTHPEDRGLGMREFQAALSGARVTVNVEKRYMRKDGSAMWVRITGSPVYTDDRLAYCMTVVEDITGRRANERRREESERRLKLAVSIAQLGFWEWDLGSEACYYSPEFMRQLGYVPGEWTATVREWTSRLHSEDRAAVFDRIDRYLANPSTDFDIEYRVQHRDGSYRWMMAHAVRIAGPQGDHMTGTQLDITERKEAAQRVLEAAQHDPLTGLPNRALVFEYAGHMISAARRTRGQGALLFIDLDRFKPINDLYGHEVGDRVLQDVARRLMSCVRGQDLVGRLGGDEFVIVMQHNGYAAPASAVAR
ncbi:PAS domain S-box protein, partial [Oxalobacteraceae bacterium OM1]